MDDTYIYTAFGSLANHIGASNSPFTYLGGVGYYQDNETNTKQVRQRPLDPDTIQWMSQDPLGVNSDPRANLYAYLGNNPVNGEDPSGLQELAPSAAGAFGRVELINDTIREYGSLLLRAQRSRASSERIDAIQAKVAVLRNQRRKVLQELADTAKAVNAASTEDRHRMALNADFRGGKFDDNLRRSGVYKFEAAITEPGDL